MAHTQSAAAAASVHVRYLFMIAAGIAATCPESNTSH